MKKVLFFYKELLATFWFVPVLTIVLAIVLSAGLVSIDNNWTLADESWMHFFLVNSADSARSILSTISGAMIGVAGTVFSVTLVALTLASSQFGPRLIKNFMYVRLNQVVLGSYIATYLYCLLVLNAIKTEGGYVFIPSLSILVAILAAVSNIVLLIVFIHQIATSIQADKIIADISEFVSEQVKNLFPEKMGQEAEKEEEEVDVDATVSQYPHSRVVKSRKSGYLQYIDDQALMHLISEKEALFDLHHRPGSYLVDGLKIGEIHSKEALEEEEVEKILDQFFIGKTKTPQQDLEFSIHQLVEIAARALSPGVNDPYTAIACIDNLTNTMSYLAQVKFPSRYRYDEEEELRIMADVLEFEGMLAAAFNQIRQFSAGSTAVIIRLMEALIIIQEFTLTDKDRQAVIKHARMVLEVGKQTIKEENDIEDLIKRSRQILD